jgi:phenylacetic acid degradation operon negative regulatory protein
VACLSIVLIHDDRRLLLPDPGLPDVLPPAEWPGQKVRLLCKELYRRLVPASERHLDLCLVLADGTIPPADPAFAGRFPQDDPQAAMSL